MIDYILLNESLFTNVLLIMGDTNPFENQYLNVVAPCKMSYWSILQQIMEKKLREKRMHNLIKREIANDT